MSQQSKGDFIDFVNDATTHNDLLVRWQNVIKQADVNAGDLSRFFLTEEYYGVSLLDCATLVTIQQNNPGFPKEKY